MNEVDVMKWRVSVGAFALILCGCDRTPTAPPEAYKRWTDQWIARLALPIVGIWPCKTSRANGDCYKMEPAQRWRGTWVTQFEAHRFCPGAAGNCLLEQRPQYRLWFNEKALPGHPQIGAEMNRGYVLDFVGRRTEYQVGGGWQRHYEIVVDRMISMKDLGPSPGLEHFQQ